MVSDVNTTVLHLFSELFRLPLYAAGAVERDLNPGRKAAERDLNPGRTTAGGTPGTVVQQDGHLAP